MAGATKLMGFDFKKTGIYLQRWGKQALLELCGEDFARAKAVCHDELPTKPPPEPPHRWFSAEYDDFKQQIVLTMTPAMCESLLAELTRLKTDNMQFISMQNELDRRLFDHRTMRTPADEPGIIL